MVGGERVMPGVVLTPEAIARLEVGDEVDVGLRPKGTSSLRVSCPGSSDGRRVRRLLLVWAFDSLRRRDVLVVAEETWLEVA